MHHIGKKVGTGIAIAVIGGTGFLALSDSKPSYSGGKAPDGSFCDYGYNYEYGQCCDEDDYSCEIRDTENKSLGINKDCNDFKTQSEAQVFFDDLGIEYGGFGDAHNLDQDDDGVVCETLP